MRQIGKPVPLVSSAGVVFLGRNAPTREYVAVLEEVRVPMLTGR